VKRESITPTGAGAVSNNQAPFNGSRKT